MKTLSALLFVGILTLSHQVRAQEELLSTSRLAITSVAIAYGGVLGGLGATTILAVLQTPRYKQLLAQAVRNDVQIYFTSGKLTAALEQSVLSIQDSDQDVSESEAVDLILESIAN